MGREQKLQCQKIKKVFKVEKETESRTQPKCICFVCLANSNQCDQVFGLKVSGATNDSSCCV